MKIFIGADHGGFEKKQEIISQLEELGHQVVDCGAHHLDPEDDYPEYAFKVGEELVKAQNVGEDALGILLCRSGAGMNMAANKVMGVRAAVVSSIDQAGHARQHNNANIATLSADWMSTNEMMKITRQFIETDFSKEERHIRRVAQISSYEQKR